jgi:uncharacterized damage-inducible protein DinB
MSNLPAAKAAVFGDVQRELAVTRKVLERVPAEHFNWKPHEKSMSLVGLALHVAYLPEWASGALNGDVLDAATAPRPPKTVASTQELLEHFDRKAAELTSAIERFDMARWDATWSMKQGDTVMVAKPRPLVFRVWCISHLVHHRGQLNLYLRLLNVPVATVYFNSADEPAWVFE